VTGCSSPSQVEVGEGTGGQTVKSHPPTLEWWSRGCARPPSPGVEARKVDARGWSVGQAPIVSEGGAGCWWWLAVLDSWPATHNPVRGS
jgi:hypothetical protein